MNIFMTKIPKKHRLFRLITIYNLLKYAEINFSSNFMKNTLKIASQCNLFVIIKAPTKIWIIGKFVRFDEKSPNLERTN